MSIIGFEEETHELTPGELLMIPAMMRGLKTKIGKKNSVKSHEMIKGMKEFGYILTGARVRKLVHHIRVNELIKNLVATSKGYYIENNPELLADYVESLDQRIRSIQEVRDSYNLPGTEKL